MYNFIVNFVTGLANLKGNAAYLKKKKYYG